MKASTKLFWFGLGLGAGFMFVEWKRGHSPLIQAVSPIFFRRLVGAKSIADLRTELEAAGQQAGSRLMNLQPSEWNYKLLNHVVGIERWGQARLRAALGEPIAIDEYNGYRPPLSLSWNELQDQFAATRRATAALARDIEESPAAGEPILHNQYGRLTPSEWLAYLNLHANAEIAKMR